MDSIKDDAELASEMVKLLGRELKVARRRISELERELGEQRKNSVNTEASSNADAVARAEAAETVLNALFLELQGVKDENTKLHNDVKDLQAKKPYKWKKEESNDNLDTSLFGKLDSELATKIQVLENDLAKMVEQYSVQCIDMQELQKAHDELEAKLHESESNETCQEQSTDVEEESQAAFESDSEDDESKQEDNIETNGRRNQDLRGIMTSFSHLEAENIPARHDLKPIYHRGMDLPRYLNHNFNCKFIHFPKRVVWSGKRHAIAFSTFYRFNVQSDSWKTYKDFGGLNGKVRELFYIKDDLIYYAGSYKCHLLREQYPQGFTKQDHMSTPAIVDVALPRQSKSKDFHRPTLAKLFKDGILKVDCMALQCVGFNHTLYHSLLHHFVPEPSHKRKDHDSDSDGESEVDRPPKRQKKVNKR